MTDRNLHLIVTDNDINGRVSNFLFDYRAELYLSDLKSKVDLWRTYKGKNLAVCALYLPESFSAQDSRQLWDSRGESVRIDDHFLFDYFSFKYRKNIFGQVNYDSEVDHENFKTVLEGTHKLIRYGPDPVGVVVDCTDHPNMRQFLENLGYDVYRWTVFKDTWPLRDDEKALKATLDEVSKNFGIKQESRGVSQ